MVAQYFKKRCKLVEDFVVAGSRAGVAGMTAFYQQAIGAFGWRHSPQKIAITMANNHPADTIDKDIIEPLERIKMLANYGVVAVDPNVPIKRYYRSGMEMVRMAMIYNNEGNYENAYILYMKFMTLFLEKILAHPEYKTYPAVAKRANQERLKEVLPITEKLRVRLLERFNAEYQQHVAEQQQLLHEAEQRRRRREAADLAAAAAQQRSRANGAQLPDVAMSMGRSSLDDDLLQPSAPPDSMLDQVVYPNDFPPAANRAHQPAGLLLPDAAHGMPKPSFDRTLKPAVPAAGTGAVDEQSLLEGGLRTVCVPGDTMVRFLSLAARNTAANVETCGILAGSMAKNKLMITHVIVPKQCGTADSCTTMNEEDIFDVQDQQNLITLGWIHTHPSQTAFLSSVDLHTHCSYQIMMPEALAIVCAPKYKTTGFFCLTPNYGLDYIAGCRQSGFHPHPNEPPLFMEARHALVDETARIQVVDLRR